MMAIALLLGWRLSECRRRQRGWPAVPEEDEMSVVADHSDDAAINPGSSGGLCWFCRTVVELLANVSPLFPMGRMHCYNFANSTFGVGADGKIPGRPLERL